MYYYTVVTTAKSNMLAAGLTYESEQDISIGCLVTVPLRKQIVEGIIIAKTSTKPSTSFELKPITKVIDTNPLLQGWQIETALWLAKYYVAPLRKVVKLSLPGEPWSKLLPVAVTMYRLTKDGRSAQPKGKKQQELLKFLVDGDKDHKAVTETISTATVKTLINNNWIEAYQHIPSPVQTAVSAPSMAKLSSQQQAVYQQLTASTKPSLLFGVTGSGKTLVYQHLIADVLKQGKQALVLLPEILLTEFCVNDYCKVFGHDNVAVIHSQLTLKQKRNTWRRIKAGEVSVVLGSRSALFMPYQHLGIIVIDEEHEWTYKQDQTPRYHARTVAQQMCSTLKIPLILGSATPSLETWTKATKGDYTLTTLPERYGSQDLPPVEIIDLGNINMGNTYPISKHLKDSIKATLDLNQQCVLFLNHRGYASAVMCLQCRRRLVSPTSNMSLTLHGAMTPHSKLVDHLTGEQFDVPPSCPGCQSTELTPIGAGTQKIEQLLTTMFPDATVLRADRDTLKKPGAIVDLLDAMRSGNGDILIGTQAVVKGLDLPNVTLAAVLLADIGLSLPTFRAGERVFQLLTQLSGRSGRHQPGKVIIQTFRPDAPEIQAAAKHDSQGYLQQEVKLRQQFHYPPTTEMIRFLCRGDDAKQKALALQQKLQSLPTDHHISAAPTMYGGGKVWHVLVRGNNLQHIINTIDLHSVIVDRDPMDIL
jgi:primosomal protein N' (replication factor Y)